jgi:hypothetical protein
MITRMGTTGITATPDINTNSTVWDLLAHPIEAITYAVQGVQSTVSGIGAPDLTSSLPAPIVLSQGAPSTIEQGTVAGAWTPTDAATTGLANEQAANSVMLTDYTNSLSPSTNWSNILLIGGVILGFVVLMPIMERGK